MHDGQESPSLIFQHPSKLTTNKPDITQDPGKNCILSKNLQNCQKSKGHA